MKVREINTIPEAMRMLVGQSSEEKIEVFSSRFCREIGGRRCRTEKEDGERDFGDIRGPFFFNRLWKFYPSMNPAQNPAQ